MPKPGAISTDAQVRALKPADRTYDVSIADSPGLCIRVHPSGRKSWELRYRNDAGAGRRMPLGVYPGTKLTTARTQALKVKARVADGADPFGERQDRRREIRHGDTLSELAASYFEASLRGTHGGRKRPRRQGAVDVDRQRFRTHIEPRLGGRAYKTLRRSDVRAFMDDLMEPGALAPATVAGVGGLLRSILQYAVHLDLMEANVATGGITRPVVAEPRARRFAESTLRVLWPALVAASAPGPRVYARKGEAAPVRAPIEPATALGLRLSATTLLRRSELVGGRWSEIDLDARYWWVPRERMKANREHVVALSGAAMAVLRQLRALQADAPSPFILPAAGNPDAHMDPRALTRGMSRTLALYKLGPGSPHDFRRTAATWLTGNGVRRFVVSWLLAHSAQEGATVTSLYDVNEYLTERAAALEQWGEYLDSLKPPEAPVDNVVHLKGRRSR